MLDNQRPICAGLIKIGEDNLVCSAAAHLDRERFGHLILRERKVTPDDARRVKKMRLPSPATAAVSWIVSMPNPGAK